jgi:leucyl aminopeptidase
MIAVDIARNAPRNVDAVGVPVATDGPVPRQVGLSRAALASHGFEGKVGQTLVVPSATTPTVIAVGVGPAAERTASTLRTAAAALARAAGKRATLTTSLADADGVDARSAAQAVVEGIELASYRYTALKKDKTAASKLERVTLTVPAGKAAAAASGAERGQTTGEVVTLARDFANTPPAHLTARVFADRAVELAKESGLAVEVIDNEAADQMGLGGLIGVNKGSVEPLRLVKLTYTPRNPQGHVALIGKGVMYDSGGISLKPSDGMHVNMKLDMTGAAVVLAVMTALKSLRTKVKVTGYLCCTDNMPSGSAMKLGDVLTIRNGKTVEIHNTDAEGRLVMADGLSLAAEEHPDAMVDIATLTGAVMGALGTKMAGVLGNDQGWVEQVRAAGARTDEQVWQLPLAREYRKLLDSNVADMKNVGGPYGGAITAALFLDEFTDGIPWAHLDIAGTMNADADEGWLTRGATAFGARLLLDLLTNYAPPAAAKS